MKTDALAELFKSVYSTDPTLIVHAPGRINLIGEHTDYNDGFVLPCAINRGITIAACPSSDGLNHMFSQEVGTGSSFAFQGTNKPADWSIYPAGVASVLNPSTPIQAVVVSDLPVGGGVSSSAALEMAFATLWNALDHLGLTPTQLAKLCQRAENEYVGVNCGIMDMLASACGVEGHALLIDTRSLDIKPVPIPPNLSIMLMDTGKPRTLAASGYNERRAQCEEAARIIGVTSLRDATVNDLSTLSDPLIKKRARHVVTENKRVIDFTEALRTRNLALLGLLMGESHTSLRDDYEVSCPELDTIVEGAKLAPGCIGARLTGAGFGGAAVALIESEQEASFIAETEQFYRHGVKTYVASISASKADSGAHVIE